ncbi:hypothetical protein F5Y12DRAFT_784859 [Xylaria sp. FL1777]|nr:hypothetical protein F5Y12DRAFT_784859 [Xylaria sp. FL1777]
MGRIGIWEKYLGEECSSAWCYKKRERKKTIMPHGRRESRRGRRRRRQRQRRVDDGRGEYGDLVQPDDVRRGRVELVAKGELQQAIDGDIIDDDERPFAPRTTTRIVAPRPVIHGADDEDLPVVGGEHEARRVARREAHAELDAQECSRTAEDEVGPSTLQGDRPASKSPLSRMPVSMGVEVHVVLAVGGEGSVVVVVLDDSVVEGNMGVGVGMEFVWDPRLLVAVTVEEDDDVSDSDAGVLPVSLPPLLLLVNVSVPLPSDWELDGVDDDAEPVITVVDDEDPLPVAIQVAVELSGVVELGKDTDDEEEICVELGGICVPEPEAELVKPEEAPIDVLLETPVVDVDVGFKSDVELVEEVGVSVAELGCQLVDVDEALEAGLELIPEESVFVLPVDELFEVNDDVTDPDPEPVPDTSVDEIPAADDTMLVVEMFPGAPSVQLEVTIVVLEFDKVVVGLFVSVLVTVVKFQELEDVSLPVADPEFIVVLPLEPGRLAWELVGEDVAVVSELALPAELPEVAVLALLKIMDEPLLLVGIGAVGLGELPPALVKVPVDIDGVALVALPEGRVNVSEMVNVAVLEVVQLEVSDVVFILDAPFEEETTIPLEICVPEPDDPNEVIVVGFMPVTEEGGEIVGSVVVESVPESIPDDQEMFPEAVVCIVREMVEVVCRIGTVVPPEIVVTGVDSLDPMLALLAVDPGRELEDKLINVVKLLLGGGRVNPG